MNDEGQFRNTNGIIVNIQDDQNRMNNAMEHEYTHQALYVLSTYGQMVMMLEKNSLFQAGFLNDMYDVMFKHMSRMQERTAVNLEIMANFLKGGYENYKNAINDLQDRNVTYYNYFRKLCCINGKLTQYSDDTEARALVTILGNIATLALNVNLKLIPFNKFKNTNDIEKFFENNGKMFSPNKRFDILINFLFRENDNSLENIKCVIDGSIDLDKIYDYEYIHMHAFNQVKELLANEILKNRLIERIQTVGYVDFDNDMYMKYLTVCPKRIDASKKIELKAIIDQDKFLKILEDLKPSEVMVGHSLGGFEDYYTISIQSEKGAKKVIYAYIFYGEELFWSVIDKINTTIVFDKLKIVYKYRNTLQKHIKKLPVYVYIDVAIGGLIHVILDVFRSGKYCFADKENYCLLIVKRKSFILIAAIVNEAKETINEVFLDNNLKKAERMTDICDVKIVSDIYRKCTGFEIIEKTDVTKISLFDNVI